ncbi:hypothetical protein [Aeromicrobium sp. Sec7.5]|uniref:hypothetical protein n=1 Tax=Aeromicrobium sp. Sec7.5 TaxID=3121276 RepID=UPI002FE44142
MTDDFVRSIESLSEHDRELLGDAAEDFFETLDKLLDGMEAREPRGLDEDALPDHFLRGDFTSVEAVRAYLDSNEPAWRLDAYLAVEDLLDQLDAN